MTVDVVELLEEVDIGNDQAERRFEAQAALPFGGQRLVEMPAIRDAGQAVERGQFLELAMRFVDFLLQRHDAQHGADLGQQHDLGYRLVEEVVAAGEDAAGQHILIHHR